MAESVELPVRHEPEQVAHGRDEAHGPRLRLLSVNACVLPSGLRNKRLPTQTVGAGIFMALLLWATFVCSWHAAFGTFELRAALPSAVGCLLVGWICGGQAARVCGCFAQRFCGWGSDHKEVRLRLLAQIHFSRFDVVCVQEIFGSRPHWAQVLFCARELLTDGNHAVACSQTHMCRHMTAHHI